MPTIKTSNSAFLKKAAIGSIIIATSTREAYVKLADGALGSDNIAPLIDARKIWRGFNCGEDFEVIQKSNGDVALRTIKGARPMTAAGIKATGGTATSSKAKAAKPSRTKPAKKTVNTDHIETITAVDKSALEKSVSTQRNFKSLLGLSHNTSETLQFETNEARVQFIQDSYRLKPSFFKISSLKWRALVRAAVSGDNILIVGPKGEGKTMSAYVLKEVLNRPFWKFDLGNTQDAQTSLLGRTVAANGSTRYITSDFIKAITTPNALILLDEFSRASRDAANILMPILDENVRSIRLTESETSEHIVSVAPGVTFMATANIGHKYTGTSVMDSAVVDRFTRIEMDPLTQEDRVSLVQEIFPGLSSDRILDIVVIQDSINDAANGTDGVLSDTVSTRKMIEVCKLISDGFTPIEALELSVVGLYSADGGLDSERTHVRKIIQQRFGSRSEVLSEATSL